MPFDDRTIFQSPEPLLHPLVRPRGGCIFAGLDALEVDAHFANFETILRTAAGNVDRIGAGYQCFRGDASGIHTRAPKFMALDDGNGLAGIGKPRSQRRPRLSSPDNDCVEVLHLTNHLTPYSNLPASNLCEPLTVHRIARLPCSILL